MSRLTLLIVPTIIAIITTIAPMKPAHAQEACGQVIDMDRMGEPVKYCNNMYDRQFEYRKQRIAFRKLMEERREEFIAPAREARKKYQKDLANLNSERTHENDVVAK